MLADRKMVSIAALLFAGSAVITVLWCGSMAAMPGMEMPGGWVMSMAWMRMPGQSWLGAAASFIGMWAVMMVWMMLPVLMPMLARYRSGLGRQPHLARLTLLAAAGYFAVWIASGVLVFPVGVLLMDIAMRSAAIAEIVPWLAALALIVAGASQFTAWKQRRLECCRQTPSGDRALAANAVSAWNHGLRMGLRCLYCCAGPTAVLLVLGVMDLWVMVVVMMVITLERLMPRGEQVARVTGAACVVAGIVVLTLASPAAIARHSASRHSVENDRRSALEELQQIFGDPFLVSGQHAMRCALVFEQR